VHIDLWRLKNELITHNYNMLTLILTSTICAITSTIFLAINPLTIGIMILIISLLLANLFAISISSWLSFLVFLIYVGGILVIFSYFVALIPNQHVKLSMLSIFLLSSSILISISIYILNINIPVISNFYIHLNTIYVKLNISSLLILAWLLLFTIIVVVKLVTNNKGPLRPFYKYV
jgi:NADH-ubiquinone oxidoreductase chain 6